MATRQRRRRAIVVDRPGAQRTACYEGLISFDALEMGFSKGQVSRLAKRARFSLFSHIISHFLGFGDLTGAGEHGSAGFASPAGVCQFQRRLSRRC